MIRALILYFLSIKPTHGYEIQKFIALNHMNDWTKIESGSIYYAIAKLEKQGAIELIREEGTGQKARKIYAITDKGRDELSKLLVVEFKKPIYSIQSDKFVAYPFVSGIDKNMLTKVVKRHIEKLQKEMEDLKKWQQYKITDKSLQIERISFEMMISSLEYQIKWHEALVDEIDRCIDMSKNISEYIKHIDFSEITSLDIGEVQEKLNK